MGRGILAQRAKSTRHPCRLRGPAPDGSWRDGNGGVFLGYWRLLVWVYPLRLHVWYLLNSLNSVLLRLEHGGHVGPPALGRDQIP